MPKIGFALGAGGARGYCHIGALRAFEEHGVKPDFCAGSSMGALIGAGYVCGMTIDQLYDLAHKTKQGQIADFSWNFLKGKGFLGGKKVIKLLKQQIGEKRFEDCIIPFAATAVDMLSGDLVVFREGYVWQAVRASVGIPIMFQPFEIDGKLLVDGGVLCRIPIDIVRDMGADIVIAIDALGPLRKDERPQGLFHMIQRYYDLTDWQINKNAVTRADVLITPDMGHRSEFIFKKPEEAIEAGYKAAVEAMPLIKEKITNVKVSGAD